MAKSKPKQRGLSNKQIFKMAYLLTDNEPETITVNGHEIPVDDYKKDPDYYNSLPIKEDYVSEEEKEAMVKQFNEALKEKKRRF